jgi:hypothetical protein
MLRSRAFDLWIILTLVFLVFMSGIFISATVSSVAGALILILILSKSAKIYFREVSLVLPLILIAVLGIAGTIIHKRFHSSDELFLTGKDLWYNLKPIVYFMSGLYIFRMKTDKKKIISLMIYSSLLIAVLHIAGVIIYFANATAREMIIDTVRSRTSFVNVIESFSLAWLLTGYKKSDLKESMIFPGWLMISVLLLSVILSFSRTLIASFVISLLAFNDFFTFRVTGFVKSIFKLLVLAAFLFIFLIAVNEASRPGSLISGLTDKFLNSFRETSYLKKYANSAVINRNWRGYETHLTWEEIKKGSIEEKILGFGFGKTVFIGYGAYLGRENVNIPKFHNGFVEIILKTGYAGLLLYIIFFFYVFRLADLSNSKDETEYLFKAVIVTAFFSTFVMTGIYNKTALDSSCLLMGFFSGYSFSLTEPVKV